MENDGPVAAVQIRLAKGEITTTQYREIMTHLMKNISSYQQTSSLKILQVRYAKSEVTVEQYQEIYVNLMKNLHSQSWSPPLQILHVRYAEGEINTAQYKEMLSLLTQEHFAYDQSTPLWLLNNRYARGELSTQEYEEILSLFTDYILTLRQDSKNPSVMDVNSGKKNEHGKNHSDIQNIPPDVSIVQQEIVVHPEKEVQSSHEKNPSTAPPESDKQTTNTIKISGIIADPSFGESDSVIPNLESGNILQAEPVPEPVIDVIIAPEDGSINREHTAQGSEKIQVSDIVPSKTETITEPPSIIIRNKGLISQSHSSVALPSSVAKEATGTENIPVIKQGINVSGVHHFPTPVASSITATREAEALPTSFLYHGGKHRHGVAAEEAVIPTIPDIHVNYSLTPLSISGGKGNTYETVTSQISQTETSAELIQPGSKKDFQPKDDKIFPDIPDLRQKIKTLIVKGDYIDAINLAESMIEENNEDFLPYFYKGMAKYYLHDHENALQDLEHARARCKSPEEMKKIETIINHTHSKHQENNDNASEDGIKSKTKWDGRKELKSIPLVEKEARFDLHLQKESSKEAFSDQDELSVILDNLGKKAQDLINNQDFREADAVLSEFIGHCGDLSQERLLAESVDEIYAALGYVRYQLKDYPNAKEFFKKALALNENNEVANQFMQDILIKAVRRKK